MRFVALDKDGKLLSRVSLYKKYENRKDIIEVAFKRLIESLTNSDNFHRLDIIKRDDSTEYNEESR